MSSQAQKRGREDERGEQAVPVQAAREVGYLVPDISATKGDNLIRPKLNRFPSMEFCDCQRRFSGPVPYNVYDWAKYSVVKDAGFCCCQFGHRSIDPAFTLNGFANWNKSKEKCDHEHTSDHRMSHLSWIEFQSVLAGTEKSVAVRLCEGGRQVESRKPILHQDFVN